MRSARTTVQARASGHASPRRAAPFGAVFASDLKPGADELVGASFCGVQVVDDSPSARAERAVRGALAATDDSLNESELVHRAKAAANDIGINLIREKIDDLAATGVIRTRPGPRNSQLYWLPAT